MIWLLWRECRLNRWILVTGLVGLLLSILLGLVNNHYGGEDNGAVFALLSSLLVTALLAGNSIAAERADRSAEFVAYLPIEPKQRLVTKLLLHAMAIGVLLGISLLMLLRYVGLGELGVGTLGASLIYGVGWLVSSIQSSPALASMAGIGALLLAWASIAIFAEMTRSPRDHEFLPPEWIWFAAFCVGTCAVASFGIGIWNFLRTSGRNA